MASRRLDISSLLCDDNPPNFSPLDALVQAATEERRRLSVTDPAPRFLPPPVPQTPHYEEVHRQRQHDHILLQPLHQDIDQRHAPDIDRRRHIQDAELQKRIEDQQRAAIQRDRAFQLERRHDRQREDHFRIQEQRELEQRAAAYQREAREIDRQQREIALQRGIEHQREIERQREIEKREIERLRDIDCQRDIERRDMDRQREIDRQRDIERQKEERQKEQERQRDLEQRRQQFHDSSLRFHDPRIPSPIITSPHPPAISHLISHPPPRKSDPGQINILNTPIHPDPSSHHLADDVRQVKKRRYSESPTRSILNDKERMTREREKMVVGELGYGRIDSPVAGPSAAPRRPGSGHGQGRKSMPVSELLLDKPIPVSQQDPRDRLLSPLGRRSPPGSQIGRAKAARKSDEQILKEVLPPPPPLLTIEPEVKKHKEEPKTRDMPKIKEEIRPKEEVKLNEEPKFKEGAKPREEMKAKEDIKPTRHRVLQEDTRHKVVTPTPIPAPLPPPAKFQVPSKTPEDDAHEWFLQQYEEDPSPTTSSRPEPPHSPSPSLSPATSTLPIYGPRSPPSSHKLLTPITVAVTLEQELEELVSEPPPSSSMSLAPKQDPNDIDMDLDVDLAVTELVAETLDDEDVKHEHSGMEVDVEDELLSLIDDRPLVNNNMNAAWRTSGPLASSSSHATTVSGTGMSIKQPPPPRSAGEAPHTSPTISASSSTTLISPAARQPSTSERGSMPPPATTNMGGVSKKSNERAGSVVPTKKKEPMAKVGTKAKVTAANATAPPKPRAKPTAKGKKAATAVAAETSTAGVPSVPSTSKTTKTTTKKTAPSASRSRSASVMPGGSIVPEADIVKPEKQEEEEDSDAANDDDKLYCVCKTKYDEDRFMIACDKCDEWYHTQCVDMPDLEVDLVDQFICPLCIEKNPYLNLRTTYKQRCLYGLRHPDPDSSKACHRAARGAFSKYCSDTCGVKYMQSRIDSWAKKGGKPDSLWESVKNAEKREGVVVYAIENEVNGCGNNGDDGGTKMEVDGDAVKPLKQHRIVPSTQTKVERETERLNALLESVMNLREEIKRGMEVVVWRERLLQLASERADQVGLCGWDQRLCFDDEEWADIGAGVLESYEGLKEDGEMDVDAGDEQWWCPGQKLCDRHAGWQTVRYKDVCKEREKKEEALAKLTTREREIRKRIEDMMDPQSRASGETTSRGTVKNLNSNVELARQFLKRKFKGSERGKKRKAPTS